MVRLPVSAGAIRKLLNEIETSGRGEHVLAVGGTNELAPVLQQQFFRGGADRGAVRAGEPEGADVYVHVLVGEPDGEDDAVLARARRAGVPVVAVAVGSEDDDWSIPVVPATDVVRVSAGDGFPLAAIARAIAGQLGEDGAPLAARVPLLREPVCDAIIESSARKNGLLAAAVWIPGADLPALARNEIRLVLRVEQAFGLRGVYLPEIGAALAAAFGLRAVARGALDKIPVAGWAVKGAIAYGGTVAFGQAALRLVEWESTMRQRDATARASL